MHQVATAPRRRSAEISYIDRKLELLERVMASMSDAIDEYDDFDDDFDVDFAGEFNGDEDDDCVVVHDRFDALRNCIIDAEEIVAELRSKLGTSDGKVFP